MSTSSSTKVCFNSNCEQVLERSRKGWRRRTGEYADLCDRCSSAYEEGKFCETFHLNSSGWRCCESCGKQIHCGCIVSFHMFVLLDAGGIECITCARKSFILTPNPAWPPPSVFIPALPEKAKDVSIRNWGSVTGSGSLPWRQATCLFNGSSIQSELRPRVPLGSDISSGSDNFFITDRFHNISLEKEGNPFEKLTNGSLKIVASQILQNENSGANCEEQPSTSPIVSKIPSFSKNDSFASHPGNITTSECRTETNNQIRASGFRAEKSILLSVGNQFCASSRVDSSISEKNAQNMKLRDARGRYQLLPRYWPRITDQELQQISGDSNSVITPLFEKMLSASDAGRIGRLVLPKKCAEAYFPPISQPEGLPLRVHDLKGKEWIFQFRFWPNNNSRMYVLEGVTPCIQSMQLQAGDIVTFSRVDPEGKLVMGYRKASAVPLSEQGDELAKAGDTVGMHRDADVINLTSTLSEADNSICAPKDVHEFKPLPKKRKSSTLGPKAKRLRLENKDMIELKLTWEQAQGLLRPPPNYVPTVVVIEGFEFEEYEQDPPVIGRPTIFATDQMGQNVQWAQCEDCCKWRKVPADVLLPSRWTCSENCWDPKRSVCSVSEELTLDQLEGMLPFNDKTSKKIKAVKNDQEFVEIMGLDTLANLAIQEGSEALLSSSQATTKHPRHRPGCRCVVCVQPPSGKGTKHRQTCDCDVCKMVKQRFITLRAKRQKKQLERDAESAHRKLLPQESPELVQVDDVELLSASRNSPPNQKGASGDGYDTDTKSRISFCLPLKGQIDLNIQPEREEELSPPSDSGGIPRLLPGSKEKHVKQQISSISSCTSISIEKHIRPNENGRGNLSFCGNHDYHQSTET